MYGKLSWRETRLHPGRALLTLLSVVIAVAAIVAVTFASDTTRRAFDEIFQTIAGRAALEVSAPVGTTFDAAVLDKVAAVPGVKAAVPLMQRRTILYVGRRGTQLMALGIDPERDKLVHDFELAAGKTLAEADGIMLNAAIARNLGLKVGDDVEMLTRRGIAKTKVVGLYKLTGTATTGQGAVLLMPLRAAQVLFKAPMRLDSIQVVLDEGADEQAVELRIALLLPTGVSVNQPAARSAIAQETSLSTEQGLAMARAFSVIVAVFIIANTFLISVTQLRKQLGTMRAIGATRRQIVRLVLSRALVLGVVGTVVGSLVGVVAAHFLNDAMGSLYATTLPAIQLTPAPFLWAVVFGLGISLAGAALPALRASHASPMEAIRDTPPGAAEGVSRRLVAIGVVMLVVWSAVLVATILGKLPMSAAVWSAAFLLVGLVLLLPLGLGPLTRVAESALRPWMPVESRLASRQLVRHRARTTLTVGVVFIAIATGIGLANSVIDNVNDVRDWYRKTIIADFFVRAMAPELATGLAADVPDAVDAQIRKVGGITAIDSIRLVSAKAAGEQVVLIIRSYSDPELQEFDLVSGDPETFRDDLRRGEVVVGSVLAERAKLKVGDNISLEAESGEQPFRIAAVANDYQGGGLTIYLDTDVARQVLRVGGVDGYVIKADPQQHAAVRDALERIAQENGLIVQSFSDVQQMIDRMMAGVVAGLWGMVVLGLVVAGIGVWNTLTMTVLEQTREFGLLRVIAMSRSQVRKTILAQALVIGLLALVPGIVAGVGLAYLIHLATLPVIGHAVNFVPHPWLMVGGFAVGLVVIAVAAWLPAERASRLELGDAMRMA